MTDHDVTAELAQPKARHLLETATLCRLAYNGADGLPRVIPIGFLWNGSAIVVCTATTAPKVRALAARPDVAITVDGGATPAEAQSVLIRGRATLETVDGIPEEYLQGTTKVMDAAAAAEFEGLVRQMYPQMVRITIEPAWARFFDYGGGRIPRFLAELAEKAMAGGPERS
ncbi:pyridoxamine 5'-phosphate oxidase family protein [Actinoplanes sp. NPDC051411]|uniref:pyridoxamine 5'-phosphate oxidase family protein n=1 Tax=Actinoplanes sp. NPDC051411 TaxID=3155522 RepID=UPI00343CE39B